MSDFERTNYNSENVYEIPFQYDSRSLFEHVQAILLPGNEESGVQKLYKVILIYIYKKVKVALSLSSATAVKQNAHLLLLGCAVHGFYI